jgi:hypothetical protein
MVCVNNCKEYIVYGNKCQCCKTFFVDCCWWCGKVRLIFQASLMFASKTWKHKSRTHLRVDLKLTPGNTKGGSIIVQLTSCLTCSDQSVLQIKTKIVNSYSWFQTSQTGGEKYNDTSPSTVPCLRVKCSAKEYQQRGRAQYNWPPHKGSLCSKNVNNVISIKRSWSKLVRKRRSTVMNPFS